MHPKADALFGSRAACTLRHNLETAMRHTTSRISHPRWLSTLLALGLATAVASPVLASDASPRVKVRKRPKRAGKSKARANPKKRGTLVTKFDSGSPLWTVRQVFHCVLDFDESSGFNCYVPHNVEINRHNGNALTHLRRYQWAHFRKYAASYVAQGKTFGLRVTRQVPAKLSAKSNRVKIFFHSRHRDNPAPITLKREGGAWRVYNNSL